MQTVPVRELQQHSSAVIRRVREGESVGITDRGELVAVMVPPSAVGGAGALVASGRVRRATASLSDLPPRVRVNRPTSEVLDELRADS